MKTTIPAEWPTHFQPVLETLLEKASKPMRSRILRTVNAYCRWFRDDFQRCPVVLDVDHWKAFRGVLGTSWSVEVTRQCMRVLYEIGTSGPDKSLRDWLLDNEIDNRSVESIIDAPWWPTETRLLVNDLRVSELRRYLVQVDAYLRCLDRLGVLPADPARHLFLTEKIVESTRYQRLSRLCVGMEILVPGHPDLAALRRAQTELYSHVWPPTSSGPSSTKRMIPDVEALLKDHTSCGSAQHWSSSTLENHRKGLVLHHDLLADQGRPLSFDKGALDVFSEYALARLDLSASTNGEKGWCLRSVATYCTRLILLKNSVSEC